MTYTRIYYCCDVHGSEICFRKILNAVKYDIYKASVVIVSGDLTGKMIVPIVKNTDGTYKTKFLGSELFIKSNNQLEEVMKQISDCGYYPYIATINEFEEMKENRKKFAELFSNLIVKRMEEWIRLAEERLKGKDVKIFMIPGNDDDPKIAEILESSNVIAYPENKVVALDDFHEMISLGATNITPWRTHGEFREEELAQKIDDLVSKVRNIRNCVFNFHCPPFGSGLDLAPKLNEELQPILVGGEILKVPVGSTAVRQAIEKYQPKLGLFGHIHESPGDVYIGRTLCLNPGSEYSEGILRGYIIDLDKEKILRYYRVEG
ncbi:MAG: metallophosphoesterase family protein [Candidatus Aenigmatarchaeota archaeon]